MEPILFDNVLKALEVRLKGYNIIGVSLTSTHISKTKSEHDAEYGQYICKKLDIPLCTFHPSEEQWSILSGAVQQDYKKGYSPDVNVLYHKYITFGSIFEFVRHDLQLDAIATTHYARTDVGENIDRFTEMKGVKLLKAVDQRKDESYLLCQVKPQVLCRTLLPLGDFTSEVVKKIVKTVNINCHSSMEDGKFAPDVMEPHLQEHLSDLRQQVDKRSGRFVNIVNWEELGKHQDFLDYKVGSCCPIKSTNFVVVDKDWKTGDIYLAPEENHPSLYVDTMYVSLANWIHKTPHHFYYQYHTMEGNFRLQWGWPLTKCILTVGATNEWCGIDHMILSSAEPLRTAQPGKFCAFYQGEECIGSSQIMRAGPSHFALNYNKYKDTSPDKRNETLRNFFNYFTPENR